MQSESKASKALLTVAASDPGRAGMVAKQLAALRALPVRLMASNGAHVRKPENSMFSITQKKRTGKFFLRI